MADPVRSSRRTVVRGAAWSVPVVAVAATAPAFAASPNVAVLQTGCSTFTDALGNCGLLTRQARLTWQVATTLTIPAGTAIQVTASRPLYCRNNRVTGTLRAGGYVGERSASGSTTTSASYPVLKTIPPGTYTFEDGFAVAEGAATVITLAIPPLPGEVWSDNSASRSVRTNLLGTTCGS
jgi:hypothetical protein